MPAEAAACSRCAATGCLGGLKRAGALALYWLVRRGCGSGVRFRSPLARGEDQIRVRCRLIQAGPLSERAHAAICRDQKCKNRLAAVFAPGRPSVLVGSVRAGRLVHMSSRNDYCVNG